MHVARFVTLGFDVYQLFNRTIALFKLIINNTPESTIHGRMTTKGRIEYHFLMFGGISILVIEVKYILGVAEERLDAIAQVIAECDGMQKLHDKIVSNTYIF